eukprot:1024443-Pleurochrysis_carterae.AAC.1
MLLFWISNGCDCTTLQNLHACLHDDRTGSSALICLGEKMTRMDPDLFALRVGSPVQLLDLGSHRLHEELAFGAHLVALDLLEVLLAEKAQVSQLLPLLGDLLAAARQSLSL